MRWIRERLTHAGMLLALGAMAAWLSVMQSLPY